ncbi:MAG TPA: hypothetical protein P5096_01730 [Patescibacteria group bacterium]|nr:hypothetical protein [Patescibacteria group bacterium]
MAKKKSVYIEKTAKDLGSVFSEFGEAVASIFKDSKLKSETQKLGENVVSAAKTFAERFQDKEVKKQFRDVSRAATKFGKGVAKTAKQVAKTAKKPAAKKCICKKCGRVNCNCGCKTTKKKIAKRK